MALCFVCLVCWKINLVPGLVWDIEPGFSLYFAMALRDLQGAFTQVDAAATRVHVRDGFHDGMSCLMLQSGHRASLYL